MSAYDLSNSQEKIEDFIVKAIDLQQKVVGLQHIEIPSKLEFPPAKLTMRLRRLHEIYKANDTIAVVEGAIHCLQETYSRLEAAALITKSQRGPLLAPFIRKDWNKALTLTDIVSEKAHQQDLAEIGNFDYQLFEKTHFTTREQLTSLFPDGDKNDFTPRIANLDLLIMEPEQLYEFYFIHSINMLDNLLSIQQRRMANIDALLNDLVYEGLIGNITQKPNDILTLINAVIDDNAVLEKQARTVVKNAQRGQHALEKDNVIRPVVVPLCPMLSVK